MASHQDVFTGLCRTLLERVEGGALLLDGAGAVRTSNREARTFLRPGVAGSLEGLVLGAVLCAAGPSPLEQVLPPAAGTLQLTLKTARGDLEVVLERLPLDSLMEPGAHFIFLRPVKPIEQSEDAWNLIAFYSLMIHEVKNPLAAIKVLVQGMELELQILKGVPGLVELLGSYLSRVHREIDRIVKLLDSVKYLSRLGRVRPVRYDLARVARAMMSHATPGLDRQGKRVSLSAPEGDAWLIGEPDEMRQVLLNLLEYAVAGLPGGPGELLMSVVLEGTEVVVRLTDPAGHLPEAPIARVYTHPEPFQGGGLGLAVVRFVLERLHGHISVVRESSGATTIEVRLPANGNQCPEG